MEHQRGTSVAERAASLRSDAASCAISASISIARSGDSAHIRSRLGTNDRIVQLIILRNRYDV
jgi:hypothetical protein